MNASSTTRPAGASASDRGTLVAVAGVALALIASAALQLEFLNGPQGSKWQWRHLSFLRTALWLLPPTLSFAAAFWSIERPPRRGATALPLLLLVAFTFSVQILGILAAPSAFDKIRAIVESPIATSYYTDAAQIRSVGPWLKSFHTQELSLHSSTHPPGGVLYYHFWQWLLGPERAPAVGACVIGFLASLGVPLAYLFSGLWTEDRKSRLTVASLYAVTPALILFFPEFDQVYPLFTMAIILLWMNAMEGGIRHAVGFGLVLGAALFFAYNLLTLGAFIALDILVRAYRERLSREILTRLTAAAGIGLGTCAAAYLVLWRVTGFQPLLSFFHALSTEKGYAHGYERPYFFFLAYNLFDFLLGAGMVPLPLLLVRLQRIFAEPAPLSLESRLTLTAVAALLVIDCSGTLAGETARVWLFLQPLLIVPAGLELALLRAPARAAVHGLHWLVLVVMACKLDFIVP